MNPSRPFILRPVATILFMVAILLSGLVAWKLLPVSALPEVDYPTIQVVTYYPGASPEVVASTITAPLERQFGQMSGLEQMSSASSEGVSVVTLQFTLSQTLDVAEQEVQAAINAANNLLPTDLPNPPIYNKVNPADTPILTIAVTSPTMTITKLEDLADTRIAQKLSQVPGVGLVSISGGQRPAVRIQANSRALAARGITLENVRSAVANANVNQAKGSFDGPLQASTVDGNDQLKSAAEFENIIIAYRDGTPVRLKDIATVIDGAENARLAAWANDKPAVILTVQRQPGANVIAVADRIKELLPQLQASLPAAIDVEILSDRTVTIRASVADVEHELVMSVALVVLVVFVFLRNLTATIIPAVAVPLSLIGTFGVMYLSGFSINNLSLMALTIATGFVVDDAIVMIENIARYIEEGENPMEAALKGSKQIGFTIISLTVSLIAVLIPLLFMGDVIGRLFREFAVTLAVAILISALISLTLTPMMSARLLKHIPEEKQGRFFHASGRFFDRIIEEYAKGLRWVLDHQKLTLAVALGTIVLTGLLYIVIPKGFFPVQDTGVIQGVSEASQSISFSAMGRQQEKLIDKILEDPAVVSLSSFIGVDGTNAAPNNGKMLINLKPKGERDDIHTVMNRLSDTGRFVPMGTAPDRPPSRTAGTDRCRDRFSGKRPDGLCQYRPRYGLPSGCLDARCRRRAVQCVRPASDLDDLHADQPVPCRAGSAGTRTAKPVGHQGDLRRHILRHARAAGRRRLDRIPSLDSGHQPYGTIPDRDDFVQPDAGFIALRSGGSHPRDGTGHAYPAGYPDAIPGRSDGLPVFAVLDIVADRRGADHHVHRAGHPL